MKLSVQLYSTYCYEGLYTYWYIYSEPKKQVSVNLIGCLSINGRKYVTAFLDLPIFDDFKVKYLPLPERYDTNFNVPFPSIISSLKSIKNILGHCRFFASDAT